MKENTTPNAHTSETDVGAFIDHARQHPELVDQLARLLEERHPVYQGRSANQSIRIRGYALASFDTLKLPSSVLPFVLEELESGRSAYLIAAAARALRGLQTPGPQVVSSLMQALENVRYHDDSLSLDAFIPAWPAPNTTTATLEIVRTLGWLKGYASSVSPALHALQNDAERFNHKTREEIRKSIEAIESDQRKLDFSCCDMPNGKSIVGNLKSHKASSIQRIAHLALEDQAGTFIPVGEFFTGKPTVVSFFYTRCMNPYKCSLTVSKLGQLQQMLQDAGLEKEVNIAAFTYDPEYDTADRIHAFGEHRGLSFNEQVRGFRTNPNDFAQLSDFFELGVNYAGKVVNQHRIELFLVDERGKLDTSHLRLQWEVSDVFEDVQNMLTASKGTMRSLVLRLSSNSVLSVLWPILLAFFPKCPVCWAAYMSVFGIAGLKSIPYSPWLIPVLMVGIGINLLVLYRGAKTRNGLLPFYLSLFGAFALLAPGYALELEPVLFAGIAVIFIGAMLNSLPFRTFLNVKRFFVKLALRLNELMQQRQPQKTTA